MTKPKITPNSNFGSIPTIPVAQQFTASPEAFLMGVQRGIEVFNSNCLLMHVANTLWLPSPIFRWARCLPIQLILERNPRLISVREFENLDGVAVLFDIRCIQQADNLNWIESNSIVYPYAALILLGVG